MVSGKIEIQVTATDLAGNQTMRTTGVVVIPEAMATSPADVPAKSPTSRPAVAEDLGRASGSPATQASASPTEQFRQALA